MEIGKYYKLGFLGPPRPRELLYLPHTHMGGALRGLEMAGEDQGLSSTKGDWCFPDIFVMSSLDIFLGSVFFSVETPINATPVPSGDVKKFIFSRLYAKGLQEHNFQGRGAHFLAERGEKEELGSHLS